MPNFPPQGSGRSDEDRLRRQLREMMNETAARKGKGDDDDWMAAAARETAGRNGGHAPASAAAPPQEKGVGLAQLQAENEELRSIIAELRQQLDDAAGQGSESFEDREREYEAMLEGKSEEIRALYVQIKELEEIAGSSRGGGSGHNPSEEMMGMQEDLVNERMQMDEERQRLEEEFRQLREDEDDLMRRMREMELQMAKGRADLTRQHNELHQLHNEIRRELESAQQGGVVNDRVRLLQRQHQEVATSTKSKPGGGGPGGRR